jgi:hypothetical protein
MSKESTGFLDKNERIKGNRNTCNHVGHGVDACRVVGDELTAVYENITGLLASRCGINSGKEWIKWFDHRLAHSLSRCPSQGSAGSRSRQRPGEESGGKYGKPTCFAGGKGEKGLIPDGMSRCFIGDWILDGSLLQSGQINFW